VDPVNDGVDHVSVGLHVENSNAVATRLFWHRGSKARPAICHATSFGAPPFSLSRMEVPMARDIEVQNDSRDLLDLAKHARQIAERLSQVVDSARLNRYADELEGRAAELERGPKVQPQRAASGLASSSR